MHYVYVLKSEQDGKFYTGRTSDLKVRVQQHNNGEARATKHRRPLRLVYYEASHDRRDAAHRERYLKTTYGRRYIRNRLRHYLEG